MRHLPSSLWCVLDALALGAVHGVARGYGLVRLVKNGHDERPPLLERFLVEHQLVARDAGREGFLERVARERSATEAEQRTPRDACDRSDTDRRRHQARYRCADGGPDHPPVGGGHARLLRVVARHAVDLVGRSVRSEDAETRRRHRGERRLRTASSVLDRAEDSDSRMHAPPGSENRAADPWGDDAGDERPLDACDRCRSTTYNGLAALRGERASFSDGTAPASMRPSTPDEGGNG